jgi:type III pantothenate kinase
MLKKISRRQNIKVHFVSHRDIKGVRLKYDKPATIGADRIASVLGALAESAPPFIIVDMGSAVTCELVDKNASYRGGLIFPGIELSLGALKTGCALLPGTSFSRPRPGPGTSTRECIRKGVWAAVSGGIEKAVSAFLEAEPGAAVFLTGEGSRFARPGDFSFRYRRKPALVFDGLLQFCGKLV